MATSPTSPSNLAIQFRLADHFEDQVALFNRLLRDAEGVLNKFGCLFQVFLAGVIDTAENAARIDLLADFDFQNDTHGRIDCVFLGVTAGADHGRCLPDRFRIDAANVTAAAGRDFLRSGGVRQQFEPVQYARIPTLGLNYVLQLAIAGAVEQFRLRRFPRFVQSLGDLPEIDHTRGQLERNTRQVGWPNVLQRL